MKKIGALLSVVAMTICLFAGCSGRNSRYKIGLAAPAATHGWVAGVAYYAEKYCKENNIEYDLTTSADAAEMEKNLNALVKGGADALVVWPQWSGMEKAVEAVLKKNIPVVSFDVDINCDGVYKVTGNNYDMGYQCAKYIADTVGEGASIAVMDVPSAGSVSQLRKQGFYDYLREIGYDTAGVFEVAEEAFTREAGYADMTAILAEHEQVDAVFSMDDEISIGVVKAVTESGRHDVHAITGGGGMQEYLNMIADAAYIELGLASALYSPAMIEDAIKTAIARCKGQSSSKIVVIPTTMVISSNVEQYIDPKNTVY